MDARALVGAYAQVVEAASQKLGVRFHRAFVREPVDFDEAFAGILQAQADGVWVVGDPVVYLQRGRIAEFALKNRLPTFANFREFVDAGGLISYGASLPDSFRRAAHHIDKILKGARPADLPVEQPTKFEIVINLKAGQTPVTVNSFVSLARQGFYDGVIFHRAINGFMIQGGDPSGDGTGGPGYQFDDEPFDGSYIRGTVAMANAGPNTNGSQFFIMHQTYDLPHNYVIFGEVASGMETVDAIATAQVQMSSSGEVSRPVDPVKIESVTINET